MKLEVHKLFYRWAVFDVSHETTKKAITVSRAIQDRFGEYSNDSCSAWLEQFSEAHFETKFQALAYVASKS